MASFTYERQVAAPPEIVFDVLTDHRRYTEIPAGGFLVIAVLKRAIKQLLGGVAKESERRAADAR